MELHRDSLSRSLARRETGAEIEKSWTCRLVRTEERRALPKMSDSQPCLCLEDCCSCDKLCRCSDCRCSKNKAGICRKSCCSCCPAGCVKCADGCVCKEKTGDKCSCCA
ncbi:metallothionein-like isoform X1 [Callorhinchus milii]|uniref:metallothionein-like isoform X1 n=1 Tax=Callorhinchus milii TaxID=7868 RepID=UPI001C3FCCF7|nr:metallothionein-like isoform X1 [Callorhinchus milii]